MLHHEQLEHCGKSLTYYLNDKTKTNKQSFCQKETKIAWLSLSYKLKQNRDSSSAFNY